VVPAGIGSSRFFPRDLTPPVKKEKVMKILMVLTSHDKLGNTGRKTGFWLEEFAAPYYRFMDSRNAEIVIASPKGGQPPLNPKSKSRNFEPISRAGSKAMLRRRPAWPQPFASTAWFKGCNRFLSVTFEPKKRVARKVMLDVRRKEYLRLGWPELTIAESNRTET
jgi:putative intracellular protease/amidase